jgi:hypothetical protein
VTPFQYIPVPRARGTSIYSLGVTRRHPYGLAIGFAALKSAGLLIVALLLSRCAGGGTA